MEEIEVIQREIKFNIGKKTFNVKYPNVGQIIDMESLKQALTGNRYGIMAGSGLKSTYMILDLVDAIVFYQICVPSVGKYLNVENYANLQLDETTELVDAFQKQIKPWFEKLTSQLYSASEVRGDDK